MFHGEDARMHYVWKPHGMPTTFGLQASFLDLLEKGKPEWFVLQQRVWGKDDEFGLVNRLDNDTA
jgi:23S rRNA-/tRNA-specific pseudouridylate synthase